MEVLRIYYLFSESFDENAQLQLYAALSEIPDLELSKPPATVEAQIAEGTDAAIDFRYDYLDPWIDFTPDAEGLPALPYFTLSFEPLAFKTRLHGQDGVKQNIEQAIDLITYVYEVAAEIREPPQYVIGANMTDTERIEVNRQVQLTDDGIRSGQLEQLFWVQIWSPDFVENIGRDRIESAPGSQLEWFDDGSVLFAAYDDPLYQVGDNNLGDVKEHFSLE